jgi:hypothetical protein
MGIGETVISVVAIICASILALALMVKDKE